jgi:hypothetical protein
MTAMHTIGSVCLGFFGSRMFRFWPVLIACLLLWIDVLSQENRSLVSALAPSYRSRQRLARSYFISDAASVYEPLRWRE